MRQHKSITERFFAKVAKPPNPDGCWEWTGNKPMSYGHFKMMPKCTIKAHRFSYLFHIGKIPLGMMVCHSCDNPACVNPAHLWLGTHQDNMDDMKAKKRQPGGAGPAGERCGRSVLTERQVLDIRDRSAKGTSYTSLAADYDVSKGCIAAIIQRRTWKHIPIA